MHMRQVPSFFGTSKTGTTHGLRDSRTNPFFKSSSTCASNSLVSKGSHLYAGRLGRGAPGMMSILCSMPRIGGNPGGIS